ncbi:hypothetical protein KY290_028798 [Solanum tuberosum]|uniref:Ulp1 protease family, C-terminal catalytic domain containing protein n=2 Tax=Solanum tuberosum TaxID=4113 RepID=A0ABQ7UIX9_SOLTU|nr:hypothetical protein KY284_027791 [Solanum tuberosum]KAH0749566.1 hypothetical protein KY290_028798 [Solanum tuberosum]
MDNQTKILVNRIYDKMKTVDESIDEKSQRLFKIRDELAKLSEQSRILQSEINQLSTNQAESMREFLLLCEHLDTRPKQNSNLKGNISPNKVAGDVPLAPSAKNISTVNLNMPTSISKDKGKSQENEAIGSSSASAEKIISGKPESKTQSPSGTKVFSSFQVGKQHLKEEEYLSFTRYIYNLPEESGETYGVLGTTSLFPRISIFPNGIPSFTAQLFEFGYLDRVYTKPDLKELSKLPSKLFEAIKNFAQSNGVYCRFYIISMECQDLQAYYPTLNYISVEKIKDFNVKATRVDKKLPHLNKKWIQTRRALGIKAIYAILTRLYREDYKVIDEDHDWVLISKGKTKSKELKERILDIELHRIGATEETWKLACKMLDHDHT